MFWSKTLGRGKAMVAAAACAWRCPCWDCRAQRRHLFRVAALVTVLMGAGGGAAYEVGRRHLSAGRPVAAMAETVFAYAAPLEAP